MKICVIGMRGFPQIEGGVEKHCEELYPRMREDILATVYRRKPYVNSDKEYDNIEFVDLPSTQIKGFEAVFHSFISAVNAISRKPDLVHFHNIGPALFAPIIKLGKIPVVLTYHSPNYEHDKWNSIAKKILLFCEKTALKYSDKIIFVNKFQMQRFPEEIRNKSIYIPNGINIPEKSPNTDYLEELGIEKNKYILSVGRITPEKGFDTLIKAYNKAEKAGYKLVIAGGVEFESSYMNELKKLSTEDVIFTGYVFGDKLAQLYTNAGLYVLASKNEGFPLVLLEAMSYDLDPIVSDIPATHLVDLSSDNYFNKDNEDELAEKISQRLLTASNKKYDLSGFNWNKVAEDTAKIYDSLVN